MGTKDDNKAHVQAAQERRDGKVLSLVKLKGKFGFRD